MKKIKTYKGFIISVDPKDKYDTYYIFTKEEYEMGQGYRSSEHEAGNMDEAKNFIDSY